jgi:hypothetical protein
MAESLGNSEKAVLIALLLTDGEITTPDLKRRHGVDLPKKTREKLDAAGLIESHTEKPPYRYRITQRGREKCETLFASGEWPTRPTALLAVVWELFGSVIAYLRWHDARLVDVVLESAIRSTYQELSKKPQDWVRLAKLRPALDGASRDDVDRVLLAMSRTGLVHLSPDSNRKALTEADRAAAIRIGSEPKHLVAIEES